MRKLKKQSAKQLERAGSADTALLTFAFCTGADRDAVVSDLICDIWHWCDREGIDFEKELGRAKFHYKYERLFPNE